MDPVPTRWYHSLYWRIALGFVLCLAAMLAVQALLLVLVASRSGPTLPGLPPDRFARAVALELSQGLERDPALDVATFVREQFGREAHPLFVLLADGREFTNGAGPAPAALLEAARERLRRGDIGRRGGPSGRPDSGADRPPPEAPGTRPPGANDDGATAGGARSMRFGRGMRGRGTGDGRFGPQGLQGPPVRPAPVIVNDRLVGVVIVPPRAPFAFLLARYGPTLGLVSVGALVVGAGLTALLVFGPARRRLRALEEAARRLGGGEPDARAPAQGGDEVAAVARAFNTMADDLAARAQALAASDRLRRQLLADVSHELTTPVTAMRGYLETLTMPDFPVDPATRDRYLRIVADETGRLERIIGDLLDLARLEGGGGAWSVEDVAISDLFDRVRARHERTAQTAGVAFEVRIDPGAERVRGDRDRLEQALQNLAANALRYAPAGSAIVLAAQPAGRGVAISVADHGPGIPDEHLAHLFDRFYKADASRAAHADGRGQGSGSGLGLSIVKAIVERHGGTVGVTSGPGHTTFTLTVPAASPV